MNRYRVAREGVEYQYVEGLCVSISQFAFHRKPCVARHDLNSRARIPQICEVSIPIRGDFGDGRVDLVEANVVSGQSVRRDRSDSESDRTHAERAVARIAFEPARMIQHDQSNAAVRAVIGSGLVSLVGSGILLAMYDLTMPQHIVMALRVLTI